MTIDATIQPIAQARYPIAQMMQEHPPRFHHPYKSLVFDIACPSETVHDGEVQFARWDSDGWEKLAIGDEEPIVDCLPSVFGYEPSIEGTMDWYLNFADPDLFGFYGGGLLAQDELQVAEHPVLASLRHALFADGLEPATMSGSTPTPCTVIGAPRQCVIDTAPSDLPGRSSGLYGNRFATAREEVIRSAVQPINLPTLTNILAIAAPPCGHGYYTVHDIEQILTTVVTGFAAAIQESRRLGHEQITIHTGFWGCGAFGGNRILTPALQLIAARWVGLPRLAFYAFDASGQKDFSESLDLARRLNATESVTDRIESTIDAAVNLRMKWGVSDGN